MINIHQDVIYYFLNFSNLKDIENLSCTCQVMNKITNTLLTKGMIKPTDLKIANVCFFKKFFPLFNIDHIRKFDYRLISREELNTLLVPYQNQKNSPFKNLGIAAKFLHSLQNASTSAVECFQEDSKNQPNWEENWKKAMGDGEDIQIFLQQVPYKHMWMDHRQNFRFFQALYRKSKGETLMEETEEDIENILEGKQEKKIFKHLLKLKENGPNKNKFLHGLSLALLTFVDDPLMQLTDGKLLEDLYTTFWRQYAIKCLNNQRHPRKYLSRAYTYMPIHMFKGLCNRIQESSGNFGKFQSWLLAEQHLQVWNTTFENRQVESLRIQLVDKIAPATFKKFSEIILNFSPQTGVEISYRIPSGQLSDETTGLFQTFSTDMSLKNPKWIGSLMEEAQ